MIYIYSLYNTIIKTLHGRHEGRQQKKLTFRHIYQSRDLRCQSIYWGTHNIQINLVLPRRYIGEICFKKWGIESYTSDGLD